MGLETYDNSGQTWLRIKHGCICQESKTEREGYKKVEGTLRDGTQYRKWIKPYKAVSGFVTKIEWYDREHEGRKFRGWNVSIDADGEPCVLDIPFASRVNSRWMKLAENLDFRKTIRFSAWKDKHDDKTAFNVQQDGVSVPQRYTREDPGDCPPPIQRRSGEWDYGTQEDFLCERILNTVIPNCEAANALRPLRNATSEDNDDGDPTRDAPPLSDPPDDWEEGEPF